MHEALLGYRYLLCSDGLTDVVGDEAVHGVLSTVPDADTAVNQLIALAIRNGGPDNITCIVADVIDPADGPVAATVETMLAGAAANGDVSTLLSAATGRAGAAAGAGVAPAPGASLNGHGGRSPASASDAEEDDEEDFDEPHRRWPVVTTVLVILVALVAGGLYVGYRATQGNYYLASDGSQVSIYRGINQSIGWISLSHVYRKTGVPLSHVPGDLTMPTTPTTLPKTLATLTSIKHAFTCTQDEKSLEAWQARYGHRTSTTKTITTKTGTKKTVTIKPPQAPPAPVVPASCPVQGAA
jgi:hypothetical protein